MPSIDSIAADYVERAAALDPSFATWAGIAGHDDELPDLSADGFAGRAELDRSALAALEAAEAPGPREQVARAAMQERLAVAVERYDAGDTTSELNVIDSWVQYVREIFDLMPTEGEEAAVNIARRMAAVPEAYRQFSRPCSTRPETAVPRPGCRSRRSPGSAPTGPAPGDSFYSGLAAAAHRGSGLAARGAGRGRRRGDGRHRRARCLPQPGAAAAGQGEGCLRARGLRPGLALLPRYRRRSAGGLCLELGGDRPAARRAGTGQQPHPAWSHSGGGCGDPGRRPGPAHRGAGELPRLDAGASRAHHLGAERQALRHPGVRAPDRGHDRPRRRRRDLLHRTFGGLVPAWADVVVGAGRH